MADSGSTDDHLGPADSAAVAQLVMAAEQSQARPRDSQEQSSFFDLRAARERLVLQNLRGVAGGFVIGLAIFIPANLLRLPDEAKLPIISFNLVLAAVAGILWWATSRDLIDGRFGNASAAGIFMLGASNILFSLSLIGEPTQTNFLVIMVIAAGCIMLSLRWLSFVLTLASVGWVWVALAVARDDPALPHFGVTLLCAVIFSVVLHQVRWRHYNQLVAALGAARREVAERREVEQTLRRSEQNTLRERQTASPHG